eukprot:445751_1
MGTNCSQCERKSRKEKAIRQVPNIIRRKHENKIDICKIANEYVNKNIPLNQFTFYDIYHTITKWIWNDINYKANLNKTQMIFKEYQLNWTTIQYLSG